MVVGSGQMGSGIAQVCAMAGYKVYLTDLTGELVGKGLSTIEKNLSRQVAKGRMTEIEKANVVENISLSTDLNDAEKVDIVIEAATENMEVKKEIFAKLDTIAAEHVILASNTSSLPITEIAAATTRPEKVIGMH